MGAEPSESVATTTAATIVTVIASWSCLSSSDRQATAKSADHGSSLAAGS